MPSYPVGLCGPCPGRKVVATFRRFDQRIRYPLIFFLDFLAGERSPLDEIAKFLAAISDTAPPAADGPLPAVSSGVPRGFLFCALFLLRTKRGADRRVARALGGSE